VIDTVESLIAEGGASLEQARWDDARRAFEAANVLGPVGESMLGLGDAYWWLGDMTRSVACKERAFELFRERGDHAQAALAALMLCFDHRTQYGNAVASGGWFGQASRLVEDHDIGELRGWMLFGASFDCDDPVRAEGLAREAHAFGVRSGDRDLELCSLSQTGVALVSQGRIAEGLRCLDESMAVSLATGGNRDTVVFTSCSMMTSCTQCAEFARAIQWVNATTAFTEEFGCPFLYAECRIRYGVVLIATGDWRHAEDELTTGLELARGAVPTLQRLAVSALAELWLAQGRTEAAERLLLGQEEHDETALVLARLQLHHGQRAAAAATIERRLDAMGERTIESGALLELLGEVELVSGDEKSAARRGRELAEFGSSTGCDLLRARGERLAGRAASALGDAVEARGHLDRALVAFQRLEMRHEAARTRAILAAALREVEPEVARAEGLAALATFEDLGAGPDADLTASFLRGMGVKVTRTGPRGREGLTKREAEVLDLLGEGLSNPEIAARLFLSRKTVEHHVASVLAKLGVRGRAEAAAESWRRRAAIQPRDG
jgi:DNA-binding CsgD family transcriptional regulator